MSSHGNSFEDRTPVDFIYGCPIIKWIAETWLHDKIPGPLFCLLLGICSDYAQPITGQVTEVACPAIGRAQPELTPSKRQKWAQDSDPSDIWSTPIVNSTILYRKKIPMLWQYPTLLTLRTLPPNWLNIQTAHCRSQIYMDRKLDEYPLTDEHPQQMFPYLFTWTKCDNTICSLLYRPRDSRGFNW